MEYRPGQKVAFGHDKAAIDAAVAIPRELMADDGRRFPLLEWSMTGSIERGSIEICARALVILPEVKV